MLGPILGLAQSLTYAEYFWDADPGVGNGTSISITIGDSLQETVSVSASGLQAGVHRLHVRSRDNLGRYSLPASQAFFIQPFTNVPQPQLASAEYFFDTDPGIGNGISIPITSGDSVIQTVMAPLSGLSTGLHTLFVRTRDIDGRNSLSHPAQFFIFDPAPPASPAIVSAEYYFDADPGVGNGTAIPITSGDSVAQAATASLAGLNKGFHTLFVRSTDSDGRSSISSPARFFIFDPTPPVIPNILSAEYFFDKDPGVGNGIPLSVTAGDSVIESATISIPSMPPGLHSLFVRVKDANGGYSIWNPARFVVNGSLNAGPPSIVAGEYFFGQDPGPGNGIPISLTPGDSVIALVDTAVFGLLAEGPDTLFVRVRDSLGQWSNILSDTLDVFCPFDTLIADFDVVQTGATVSFVDSSKNATDYFWDFGDGTTDTVSSPGHLFPIAGTYLVRLIASNVCGADTFEQQIISPGITFEIDSLSDSTLNLGQGFVVYVSLSDSLNPQNQFLLELSDAIGDFSNGQILDTVNAVFGDSLRGTLPLRLEEGCSNYQIRIRATDPAFTTDNSPLFINGFARGEFELALDFSQQAQYALIDSLEVGNSISISMWVRPDSQVLVEPGIFSLHDLAGGLERVFVESVFAESFFQLFPCGNQAFMELLRGRWQYITITIDATGETKLYNFGQLVGTYACSPLPSSSMRKLYLGSWGGLQAFKGLMDEVSIWDTVLSQPQIFQHMRLGLEGDEPGLSGYWNFNECSGNVILDQSVHENHGILVQDPTREVSTVPNIGQQVVPDRGGNINVVTVRVIEGLIENGATFKLTHPSLPDIVADTAFFDSTYVESVVQFDLTGKALGIYDVEAINPDGTLKLFPQAFTIEEGIEPDIRVDIVGRTVARQNRTHRFMIIVSNIGNVDAKLVPVGIAVPDTLDPQPFFLESSMDSIWSFLPHLPAMDTMASYFRSDSLFGLPGRTKTFLYQIPWLPPGETITLGFETEVSTGQPFNIRAWSSTPLAGSPIRQFGSDCLTVVADKAFELGLTAASIATPGNPITNVASCINSVYNAAWDIVGNTLEGYFLPYERFRGTESVFGGTISDEVIDKANFRASTLDKVIAATGRAIGSTTKYGLKALFECKDPTGASGLPVNANLETISDVLFDELFPKSEGFGGSTYPTIQDCDKMYPDEVPEEVDVDVVAAYDPNAKIGPAGVGAGNYINSNQAFYYEVLFENVDSATAAAQEVFIFDTLDISKFDLESFRFQSFGFRDKIFFHDYYTTDFFRLYMADSLAPFGRIWVRIEGNINKDNGAIGWRFTTIDSMTRELTNDPLQGFLLPNVNSPEGEGFVAYTVKLLPGIQSGDTIENNANIVFDLNPPILTETWSNIIDDTPPQSQLFPTNPTQLDTTFTLAWDGIDSLSKVAFYNVYMAVNQPVDSLFRLWLFQTDTTSAEFTGQVDSSYYFYVVATDSVGNRELKTPIVEASTQIISVLPTPSVSIVYGDTAFCVGTDSIILKASDGYQNYAWNTGDTSQQITVYGSGNYYVIGGDNTGLSSASVPVRVNVFPRPFPELNVSESVNLCVGDSLILSSDSAYVSYLWSTGELSHQIVVDQAGRYYLEAVVDTNGCTNLAADTLDVSIVPLPPQPQVLTDSSFSFCEGDSLQLYTDSNWTQYVWSTGAESPDIWVTEAGSYSLSVKDSFACQSPPSDSVLVVRIPKPETPEIQASGGQTLQLSSTLSGDSYQWYLNEQIIPGATDQQLVPIDTGEYQVQIWKDGCASDLSEGYAYYLTSSSSPFVSAGYTLYPNPSSGKLILEGPGNKDQQHWVYIFDMLGRKWKEYGIPVGSAQIKLEMDVSELADGAYWLWMDNGSQRLRTRFVKEGN